MNGREEGGKREDEGIRIRIKGDKGFLGILRDFSGLDRGLSGFIQGLCVESMVHRW